jgi:hypothetical protein
MPALNLRTRSASTPLSPTSLAFIIIGSICALVAIITICIIFPRLQLYFQGKGADQQSYRNVHPKWSSSQTSSRANSPEGFFKHLISKPVNMSQAPFTKENVIEVEHISPQSSTESLTLPARPVSMVSPLERKRYTLYPTTPSPFPTAPRSCTTYFTSPSLSMAHSTTPPLPSPAFTYATGELSPTPSTFTYSRISMPAVQEATQMSFTRAAVKKLGTIRKSRRMRIKRTVEVRISNHTNHGSPIRVGRPEARW